MKKNILLAFILLFNYTLIFGQDKNQEVPLQSDIRYGVLDNGLTYYILHNEEPKNRASFYIMHNVGAILEEDNQNGLAHFLEHMAFNGTEHFPDKGIINYLEKNGVKFGRNINAYTSRDETVYNISSVPTENKQLIDSCLLILNDWSQNLLLTEKEIDAERGVITEEWRTRRDSKFRIMKKKMALYSDSKYSERDVIGDLDVVQNHKYKTLRKFYKKWYRTDLQAIVIVGDIDTDVIENEVKELFSQLPKVKNPAERKYYDVPDNVEPRYVLATDKETTGNTINLMFKSDAVKDEDKNLEYIKDSYTKSIFKSIIKERVSEKLQEEDPSFINARIGISTLYRTKTNASIIVSHKEENWENALTDVCKIVENVRDYGFTETEFERAKINLLRTYENSYKRRSKTKSDMYVRGIKSHFLRNEPNPGIEYKYNYLKEILPQLKIDEINKWAQLYFKDENMLIAVSAPEKENAIYPDKEGILKIVDQVKKTTLEAYKDSYIQKELMPKKPVAGSIISINEIKEIDAKEYILSNGIKVYAKKTDIEKEKIQFTAHSWGGVSKLDENAIPNYMLFKGFVEAYGVSDFTATELKKALTGKIVSIKPSVSRLSENLVGSSSPQDLETMFQLVNLYFNNPRFDEKAFNAVKTRYLSYVKNMANDINGAFKDSITLLTYNYHPRIKMFNEDLLNKITYKGVKELYIDRIQNPGDFTYVIIGDYDENKLKAFLELYIASLPVSELKENYTDHGIRSPKNEVKNYFEKEMTTPKASVSIKFLKEAKYSEKNKVCLYMISQLLSKRYMDEIREKEGGTYGVSVKYRFKEIPYEEAQLSLLFDCDHVKSDKLISIALSEIQQLIDGKVLEVDLGEVKENLTKERVENVEKLKYWYTKLYDYAIDGNFTMSKDEFNEYVMSVSSEDIVKKANEFLKDAVKLEVVMTPKE